MNQAKDTRFGHRISLAQFPNSHVAGDEGVVTNSQPAQLR